MSQTIKVRVTRKEYASLPHPGGARGATIGEGDVELPANAATFRLIREGAIRRVDAAAGEISTAAAAGQKPQDAVVHEKAAPPKKRAPRKPAAAKRTDQKPAASAPAGRSSTRDAPADRPAPAAKAAADNPPSLGSAPSTVAPVPAAPIQGDKPT